MEPQRRWVHVVGALVGVALVAGLFLVVTRLSGDPGGTPTTDPTLSAPPPPVTPSAPSAPTSPSPTTIPPASPGLPSITIPPLPTCVDPAAAAPLPVELTAFSAATAGADALLTWSTASEKNSDFFDVQVSTNGSEFRSVGRVSSKGNSSRQQHYRLTDTQVARYNAAVLYYRLRQVDLDGTATYSAVRTVALPVAGLTVQAYPVPARRTSVQLAVSGAAAGVASFTVTNALGQALLSRQVTLSTGANSLELPEAAQWPRGVYVLRLTQGTTHLTSKLVCE